MKKRSTFDAICLKRARVSTHEVRKFFRLSYLTIRGWYVAEFGRFPRGHDGWNREQVAALAREIAANKNLLNTTQVAALLHMHYSRPKQLAKEGFRLPPRRHPLGRHRGVYWSPQDVRRLRKWLHDRIERRLGTPKPKRRKPVRWWEQNQPIGRVNPALRFNGL